MISLLIKGDMVAAFAAADRHNVELTAIQTVYKAFGSAETHAACNVLALPAVIKWYLDGDMPYPTGSLLLYSVHAP